MVDSPPTVSLLERFCLVEKEIDKCQDEVEFIDLIDEWEVLSRLLSEDIDED